MNGIVELWSFSADADGLRALQGPNSGYLVEMGLEPVAFWSLVQNLDY